MIAIDHACHKIIYEATGNEFLQDTLNTMYTLSLRLWYFGLAQMGSMRHAVLEHRNILAALESRNADLAAELTQLHIRAFQEEIQAMILGRTDL
jgi:DNA-binding GntR family transcriptional regulator